MRPEARLLLLAVLLAAAGNAHAWAEKAKATTRLSDTGRAHVTLAQSFLESGRLKEAEDSARAAVKSDPGAAATHALLGVVQARGKQDRKAGNSFARALELAPRDGAVLNAYGAWLCGKGDFAGADNAFRVALEDPRYTTPVQPLVNAGQCAVRAGEWLKADAYLRRALALVPRNRPLLLLMAETQMRLGRPQVARAFVQRADSLGPDGRTLELAARVEAAAGDAQAAARYQKRLREEFPNHASSGAGARTK